MSDSLSSRYSLFIPLVILIGGFVAWFIYQDYLINGQRIHLKDELSHAEPIVGRAQQAKSRFASLVQDIVETGTKDANAAQIVTQLKKAGILVDRRDSTGTEAAGTNAAPTAPAK